MTAQVLEYWSDNGWYVGRLRGAPEVCSQGETLEELKENIGDAYRLIRDSVCESEPCDTELQITEEILATEGRMQICSACHQTFEKVTSQKHGLNTKFCLSCTRKIEDQDCRCDTGAVRRVVSKDGEQVSLVSRLEQGFHAMCYDD